MSAVIGISIAMAFLIGTGEEPLVYRWIAPEIGHLRTRKARQAVWFNCLYVRRDLCIRYLGFGLVTFFGVMFVLRSLENLPAWSRLGLFFGGWPIAWHCSFLILWNRRLRRALRENLRLRGYCEACGFDLRKSGRVCPECGLARGSARGVIA